MNCKKAKKMIPSPLDEEMLTALEREYELNATGGLLSGAEDGLVPIAEQLTPSSKKQKSIAASVKNDLKKSLTAAQANAAMATVTSVCCDFDEEPSCKKTAPVWKYLTKIAIPADG